MAALALLLGCATLRDVSPGPPALSIDARAAFDTPDAAGVLYTEPASAALPILPLQVWGLRYALDLVLVSDHPDWVMHEYARIDLPTGSIWMAKDAGKDREQTITAAIPDLRRWVPEVPVRRVSGPLQVETTSSNGNFNLHLTYVNPLGQPVEVRYHGPLPTQPSKPRNGNTMGHSARTVMALLDLHLFRIGGEAHIRIDGEERKLHALLGLLPERYLLAQTQGGLAITDFTAAQNGDQLVVRRPGLAVDWPTEALETWTYKDGWLSREDESFPLRYHYTDGELDRAQAWQAGVDVPVTDITFSPALPDLRRRWLGTAESRFAVDIAGQKGHGVGHLTAKWTSDTEVTIEVTPEAPAWFAARPMRSVVTMRNGETWVRTERTGL